MQARINIIMCLHQGFQAYLARAAQEGVVGANIKFNVAFAGFVMSAFVFKGCGSG